MGHGSSEKKKQKTKCNLYYINVITVHPPIHQNQYLKDQKKKKKKNQREKRKRSNLFSCPRLERERSEGTEDRGHGVRACRSA